MRNICPNTSIQHWLCTLMALAMVLTVNFACGDDDVTEPDTGAVDVATADADAVDEPEEDTAEVSGEDPAAEEMSEPDPCPGSISCYDPQTDQGRASICHQAGYHPDTNCVRTEDGTDACCVPPFSCTSNEDCEGARVEEGFCSDERFDCICNLVDGSCTSALCAADTECEGTTVCQDGVCVEPGSTDGLVARILSPPGVLKQTEPRQLVAVAVDPSNPSRMFEDVPLVWSSSVPARIAVDADGVAVGGSEAGAVVITARVDGNDADPGDELAYINYLDSTADVRVVVINEGTRQPIEGATVLIDDGVVDPVSSVTDALGVAEFGATVGSPYDVSVFHDEYAYVTFVGVTVDDILVVTAPVSFAEVSPPDTAPPEAVCDIVRGEELCFDIEGVDVLVGLPDYTQVANPGEVDVSLTGFGLDSSSLLDLNFESIVGPGIDRDISDGPVPVEDLVEIPGGVTLSYNRDPLVPFYLVTSPPGERLIWMLGGRISLSDNPTLFTDIIEQLGGEVDIAQLIAVLLPLFTDFYSALEPAVTLEGQQTEDSIDPVDLDLTLSLPVGRRLVVWPPTLPTSTDEPLETGFFLAGAFIQGHGFVPLGISAAVDGAGETPMDRELDGDPDTLELDPVVLSMAPMHSGIGGPLSQYVVVSVALPLQATTGGGGREHSSGVITRVPVGEPLPDELILEETDFPALPEGSTFNPTTRTVTVVPNDDFDADFYRVLFRGNRGRTWRIHFPIGVTEFIVPDPAAIAGVDFQDRTDRNKVSVLAVRLEVREPALVLNDLLALGGPNLTDLIDYVVGFALFEMGD